jgi:hypothetical protein
LYSNSETDLLTAFRNGQLLENLIYFSIKYKKKTRAGMNTPEDINNPALNLNNRSMIMIGG